jgi:putative hydrolase of the HAD superfamily
MPIPSFIALDLDDTILDYSASAEAIWPRLYRDYAAKMNIPMQDLQRAADESRRWFWSDADRFREGRLNLKQARRIFVRDAFAKLGRPDFETADALADAFSSEREIVVRPFPGALETLGRFRESGARMVLLTNGESALQRAKIERFGLAQFFDGILIEGETGFGKPDLRAHRAALALLGAQPPQAWMIGDDLEFDVRPAKGLGMHAAWIHDPSGAGAGPADCVVPSLLSLAESWIEK